MKKAIVLLLLLANILAVSAQYGISVSQNNAHYDCTVTNTGSWTEGDLITWIFPDGQYMKGEMNLENGTWEGNVVEWAPITCLTPNSDGIIAYVAKKGGTTNPSILMNNDPWVATANSPSDFYFPPNKSWQVNRTWEFSPGHETYLILSYKVSGNCPSPAGYNFELILPPEIILLDAIPFNGESVTPLADKINISDLPNLSVNYNYRHVFLKLQTIGTTPLGKYLEIIVNSNFCSASIKKEVLGFFTQAEPHDPNKKIVNIKKICAGETDPTQLIYTIQFHNDGNKPVKNVDVKDDLPDQLNPTTFIPENVPILNGITDYTFPPSNDPNPLKEITFSGPGLPGINQTNPSYSYDQTIYRFSFKVTTFSNLQNHILNKADVYFHNGNIQLGSVSTNMEETRIDVSPPDCYPLGTETHGLLKNIAIQPNPFQEHVDISFELLEKSRINVEVHDLLGRLITTLVSGELDAGSQNFTWQGTSNPEGIYLILIHTENSVIAKRITKG